jgi:hypothetical protein
MLLLAGEHSNGLPKIFERSRLRGKYEGLMAGEGA